MGRHDDVPVASEPDTLGSKEGRRDTHPAFGVAVVHRSSGSSRSLFQSDLKHQETIVLSVRTAERVRDLNHDWVHPREELVEIEMSLSQWGALVSSIGIGSGVPVTIRSRETEPFVPGIPFEPRIAENIAETRAVVRKLLSRVRETLTDIETAVEQKKGLRAIREALRIHRNSVMGAENTSAFAVTSLAEAAEKVTSQAKSDIEAHILAAAQITGLTAPVVLPELERGED